MKKLFVICLLGFILLGCETVNNNSPQIIIKKGVDTISVGTKWIDAGCKVADKPNTPCIIDKSNVNLNKIGEYKVIYQAKINSRIIKKVRKVTVIDDIPPKMKLKPGIDTVKKGSKWIDAGVIVTDNYDSNINYTVVDMVDTTTIGEYIVTYKALDLSGNTTTIVRYVNVVNQ